jgi:hypothetical protein
MISGLMKPQPLGRCYTSPYGGGGADDDAKWQDALDFMIAHGQSFDWILCGSPTALICKGAALAVVEQRQKQAQSDDAILLEMEKGNFPTQGKNSRFRS